MKFFKRYGYLFIFAAALLLLLSALISPDNRTNKLLIGTSFLAAGATWQMISRQQA